MQILETYIGDNFRTLDRTPAYNTQELSRIECRKKRDLIRKLTSCILNVSPPEKGGFSHWVVNSLPASPDPKINPKYPLNNKCWLLNFHIILKGRGQNLWIMFKYEAWCCDSTTYTKISIGREYYQIHKLPIRPPIGHDKSAKTCSLKSG